MNAADPVEDQLVEDRFVLDLPPDAASIRTARLFAAAIARHFLVNEDAVEDLKLAISEACTNAVKAHAEASVSDPVTITAQSSGDAILFEVSDAGNGFIPPPVEEMRTPPQGLFEGSLGLTLINSLFPDVQIVPNPERGVTVSFRCPAGTALLDPS
jgi:serine/threonine-protein kinase RsbW